MFQKNKKQDCPVRGIELPGALAWRKRQSPRSGWGEKQTNTADRGQEIWEGSETWEWGDNGEYRFYVGWAIVYQSGIWFKM